VPVCLPARPSARLQRGCLLPAQWPGRSRQGREALLGSVFLLHFFFFFFFFIMFLSPLVSLSSLMFPIKLFF
jgi:hypothetical protein